PLFLLMIPLEGEAEIVQGAHHSKLARGNFVVIDPREVFELNLNAAQRHLTVGIPPDALKRALALRGEDSGRMAFSLGALKIDGPGETLMRFTDFLCAELDRPQMGALAPQVATTLEDSFLQLFLAGALEENETELHAMPRSVRVAQRFMLAHLKQPISVSDVAAAADVSERTLRAHFASACGTRPGNRLLQLRLEQARHDLMGDGSATNSVTEVALRYCFGNVGRFARHYRDSFGENPSHTLARAALHPTTGQD
ncbi:AraC family transcriptional regulator, partial [Leisingera sp.]|uniref:AraC family transcriptional regulator n=1 Tax=Leisingera sp. TaxID=1879318 RepID=UPI002B268D6D